MNKNLPVRGVGAGRPLRDRPYPPLTNRACTFPRTRLSPSPGYFLTQFSGQHPHTPLSFSAFSQVPLAHFPPDRFGFTCVTTAYPSCRDCLNSLHKPLQPYIG